MTIADAHERSRALEAARSFCVTAPAGSGKTELLIQRFLVLLARVEKPEQVLAITFTRKAAAEMRERVLDALDAAILDQPIDGEHQRVTRNLALAALERSHHGNWQITRDVSRLNIKTIDSFCAGLTRQMPILSQFGGQAQAVDDARPYYAEAVADLFEVLDSNRPEAPKLKALLLHFDNNWDRARELLVTMLGKRDQWHNYMGESRSSAQAEASLLATVESVVEDSLETLHRALDPFQDELFDLLCYSLGNKNLPVPDDFPAPIAEQLGTYRSIGELLLTQSGTWRKSVTKNEGFPAGKGEPTERKAHLKDLIGRLSDVPELIESLHTLGSLPDMSDNSQSWQMVLQLSHVLPLLSACLLVVFQRRGIVDHSQVALSALDALGDDEAPTELALRLDYRIEHILVDEFQDTAINQYQLVSRLTRGWGDHNDLNPTAPRTIFIVGDGMQSIYGFRDANVGLFLQASARGFNGVELEALSLKCNFRSDAGVVDWINSSFKRAFPSHNDVRRGRVGFSPAVAVKPQGAPSPISLNAFYGEEGAEQEAAWLVEQLRRGLQDPAIESIAVLGRSRNHLAPVMELLRQADIPFAAQDMERLSASPAILDLMSLCRALANPADRVAWFAILRAPWCGLTLADIHVLASDSSAGRHQNMLGSLLYAEVPAGLSDDGRTRFEQLRSNLRWAREHRDRLALRVWLEQLWLRLGGAACLANARHLQDAERFFELLQLAEKDGVGLEIEWLQQRLDKLFASAADPEACIQIMTLHKAKGLEFDWVFIPALGRVTRGESRDILLWDEVNGPNGERGFLLAGDDHSDAKTPSLYNYLKAQRKQKSQLETTRLLYVGVTRAIKKLSLSACLSTREELSPDVVPAFQNPSQGSLLATIWQDYQEQMHVHLAQLDGENTAGAERMLYRLHAPWNFSSSTANDGAATSEIVIGNDINIPERVLNREERFVGTAIHLGLELLSNLAELPKLVPPQIELACTQCLQDLGLHGEPLQLAIAQVGNALQRTLTDDTGRWILSAQHKEAYSEMALTRISDGKMKDIIIDRTFLDQATGLRWIVDYKSSAPLSGESFESFFAREETHYLEQLRTYRDSLQSLYSEPLRCALYFTSVAKLHVLEELDES